MRACVCVCVCECVRACVCVVNLSNFTKNELWLLSHRTIQSSIANEQSVFIVYIMAASA